MKCYIVFNLISLGFRPRKDCEVICRPPTIVGDQLRRGGKYAGLNPLFRAPYKVMIQVQ